jgi:uncharacterized protein YjeT (DUF2065 family)
MELIIMKIIGWYLILTSIVVIVRFKHIQKVLAEMKSGSRLMLFMFGTYELILGLIIVTSYNVWEWSPKLVVTILGWGALIEGIAFMAFPKRYTKLASWSSKSPARMVVGVLVGLVLGVYLIM